MGLEVGNLDDSQKLMQKELEKIRGDALKEL